VSRQRKLPFMHLAWRLAALLFYRQGDGKALDALPDPRIASIPMLPGLVGLAFEGMARKRRGPRLVGEGLSSTGAT
jgi:hypothetical protein